MPEYDLEYAVELRYHVLNMLHAHLFVLFIDIAITSSLGRYVAEVTFIFIVPRLRLRITSLLTYYGVKWIKMEDIFCFVSCTLAFKFL